MKETSFINQNKDKWRRFEELNKANERDPDELSRLFIEITEDLSYARTHYPKRSVRVYLNYTAQNIFTSLYKLKREPFQKFFYFWTTVLPLELYRARKNLLLAFIVFLVAAAIGLVSTAYDLSFARVILSDGYVDMTNAFIEEGDPMAVYKQSSAFPMFVEIFFNNIRVAFFSFILGIFFSLGTAFFIIYNGIMVGTFQSYFYFKGLTVSAAVGKSLLLTTFLTIWIHGAFEISALIISAGAGFTLGNGLLFPGTYSRLQSLQLTAKRGMYIMLGITPFIFVAALFESWVTRHTEMPDAMKWSIILGSFAIMVLYFVIYPFIVARKNPEKVVLNDEPLYHPERKVDLYKIRQTNEIFSDSFALYRNHFRNFIKVILTCVVLQITILSVKFYLTPSAVDYELWWYEVLGTIFAFGKNAAAWQFFSCLFVFSLLASGIIFCFRKAEPDSRFYFPWLRYFFTNVHKYFIPIGLLYGMFAWLPEGFIFFCFFLSPVLLYLASYLPVRNRNFVNDFTSGISSGFSHWGNNFLLQLVMLLICSAFFLMNASLLMLIALEIADWHIITQFDGYWAIINFIKAVFDIAFVYFALPLIFFGFALHYYTVAEKEEATSLFEKLKHFGKHSKTHETEEN